MHACLQKHVAFNRRVLKNEEEISGINSELAQSVHGLSSDSNVQIYICVNDAPSTRGSQPIHGQYWRQGELQLASTNMVYFDADNSKKSVALSALYAAVAWRHALEIVSGVNFLRLQQRAIVYPKILQGRDSSIDFGGNRQKLYEEVAKECAKFAHPPVFLCEDDPATKQWPELSENVVEWMYKAEQIAIGSFKQVLENGPDVCNSEGDSENSDHGEELEGAYTPEMPDKDGKPKSSPKMLTAQEAAWQRAVAKRKKSQVELPSPPPMATYLESSDSGSEPGTMIELRKVKRLGTKGPRPARSIPVDTNQGRAGGLGTAGGSGQKDTRVARSHPSKT
jgi:hypothetical protein